MRQVVTLLVLPPDKYCKVGEGRYEKASDTYSVLFGSDSQFAIKTNRQVRNAINRALRDR